MRRCDCAWPPDTFGTEHRASFRGGNDLEMVMTKISILKYVSILHTFTLPDDEISTSHDFNHNKGSR